MKFAKNVLYIIGILGISAASAWAKSGDMGRVRVDDNFEKGQILWNGNERGYTYRMAFLEKGGTLHLCGAGAHKLSSVKSFERKMLRQGSILMNGKPIIKNLSYFTEVRNARDLDNAVATCRDTGVPIPTAEVDLELDWGRTRFRD